MSRPLIVHISGDYPDAVQPRKTRAIANLIEGTSEAFEHRVYSLNRVPLAARGRLSRPGAVEFVADDGRVASLTYAAPSGGIFLAAAMRRVAAAVLGDLDRHRFRPAAVQGHKLSIEGLAARPIATALAVPYALSLQGNTDQKIISIRRDLWGHYRQVYREASAVFPFAPWIARWCEERLGPTGCPPVVLPCVLAGDALLPPVDTAGKIVSAFHLQSWRLKNIRTLLAASAKMPDVPLEIAGDGPRSAQDAIDSLIAQRGMQGRARRIGHVPAAAMQSWMNNAAVFAMPSLHETFGMVFVEALLAGCPIVYPAGRAVDGYFDGCGFALAVPPRDATALADAIRTLIGDQERRKADLARWQRTAAAEAFRRDAILSTYREGLRRMIGGRAEEWSLQPASSARS